MKNRVVTAVFAIVLCLGAVPATLLGQPGPTRDGASASNDPAKILTDFLNSPEARNVARSVRDPAVAQRVLVRMFASFLDRRPAPIELREGRAHLARTGDLGSVVEAIVGSREYARGGADTRDFVIALYRGVLGRTPARGEVESWVVRVPSDAPPSASPSAKSLNRPSQTGRLDPQVGERLKTVMLPLIKAMNKPLPLDKVRVGVLSDPQINAANAGGGEFYVTLGLLEKASDEQLRGVMAHEVAHADLGHVAKLKRLGLGLNIGALILDQIVPGAGAIAPIAGQLITNAYTRKEEYAADAHGVTILDRAGHDGQGLMVNTLTWLQQSTGGSGGGFFATHPATGDRIEAVRRER